MNLSLVRKEVRQHWVALLVLGALAVLGWFLIMAVASFQGPSANAFEGLRLFVAVLVPLSSLVLCHRLVVTEYQSKTQLFLEGLPLRRWRMVAAKYWVGLLAVLVMTGLPWAGTCWLAWRRDVLTPGFASLLATRAFSAAWCVYGFCFLMGFLGRYRVALFLLVGVAAGAIHELSDFKLDRLGPVVLLDDRFPYERDLWPWEALQATWGLGAVFLLASLVLGLSREGSVAARLAEKMSHREKLFMAALLMGLLCTVAFVAEKKEKAPFDLHDAVLEERPGVRIKVAAVGEDERARLLASYLATELGATREYLGLEELPPVFVLPRRDLDANRYERGELEEAEGVHVQANFEAPAWEREQFLAWLLREVLIVRSAGRVKLEPKLWVLDGFGPFWTARAGEQAPLSDDRRLALRAVYGVGGGLSGPDLHRWLSLRERLGGETAAAVAWSGLKTLARRQGTERCRSFVRSVLGRPVMEDFRSLWAEWREPTEELLWRRAGVEPGKFLAQWQEELALAREDLKEELARLPRLRGQVRFVPLSAQSRAVRYRLAIQPAPTTPTRYSFLYHVLPPYDEEVPLQSIRREQQGYEAGEGEVPESFGRGVRLYWTFAVEVPVLGCEVISGWVRQEVP